MGLREFFEEAAEAKKSIKLLEAEQEQLRVQKGRKQLPSRKNAKLVSARMTRRRFNTLLAAAVSGGVVVAGGGGTILSQLLKDEEDSASAPSAEKTSVPLDTRKVDIDYNDPDGPAFKFKRISGVLDSLPPEQTCVIQDPVEFSRRDLFEKFGEVITGCKGKAQSDGRTYLKCTIPGYKPNSELFSELERIFVETGIVDKNAKIFARRTFVFHREDGKDGIPMPDISNFDAIFTKQAKTQAQPGMSHSFSNIPLSGDKLDDIAGLATEICQTLVIPISIDNPDISETICNSYNVAVKCAYAGMSYKEYNKMAKSTALLLKEGGKKLRAQVFRRDLYKKLEAALANQPDILVPVR